MYDKESQSGALLGVDLRVLKEIEVRYVKHNGHKLTARIARTFIVEQEATLAAVC